MLRQRDTSKNIHQSNGPIPDTQQSPTKKYGLLLCLLFTIIIAYYVFGTDSSSDDVVKSKSLSAEDAHELLGKLNPMSRISGLNGGFPLKPKVLSDLSPGDAGGLERLMKRSDKMDIRNKLNNLPFGGKFGGFGALKKIAGAGKEGTDDVDLPIKEISFKITPHSLGKAGNEIFVREVYPTANDDVHDFIFIFLHGAAYTSATWKELGILDEIAKQGYTSYAIDLPGYGESEHFKQPKDHRWLIDIIETLVGPPRPKLGKGGKINPKTMVVPNMTPESSTINKKYVLVTPSMSGQYAIPLLWEKSNVMGRLAGMITVAPVSSDKYTKEQYQSVTCPVLIIYGENDTKLGKLSTDNLSNIPTHKVVMVKNGEHAAYKTDPDFFTEQIIKWATERED